MVGLTLLIDMDNVCADLMKKWLGTYNVEFNDNVLLEHVLTWKVEHYATKCSPRELYAIVERPGFFADLDVFPGAVEVSKQLQDDGHSIFFVTATPLESTTGGYDKCCWVQQHFPHIGKDKVIHAHHKHMIMGDVLLDDSPYNLSNWYGIKVAMDMPYNKDVNVNYRVKNWNEFAKVVNTIYSLQQTFNK